MLPKTLILIDTMPCTASASHVHAPGLPQGPTYLPLGRTPSTLVNTRSAGMPTMLEYLFYFILGIVIYRYCVWQEFLAMVPFEQCHVKYKVYLYL